MITGFVLFPMNDLGSIIRFANQMDLLGEINDVVYNASFASINLSNGQAIENKKVAKNLGNATVTAYNTLLSASWRATAYGFCTHGCLGVVIVKSYDTYNTAINGAYHQIVNGSCSDVFTVSDDAW